LQPELLPYPLPPWVHRFRTLSIFCEVDEQVLAERIMQPLELISNIVQITVMHFESTVPNRPYYDSAVIAQVRHGDETGGTWAHAFTSTDQVLSGTREIWGYNMKLSAMELHVDQNRIWGHTSRLGRRIISINMTPGGDPFDVPDMFPRLFVKALPETDRIEAVDRQVIMMVADTETTQSLWGEATIDIEPSEDDPLHLLAPKRILGASYVAGNQVLNPGRIVG
ncbi:MAG: acetoacetate decarboxylase family protein, partial [Alphaproteobacteria bacterium]